MWWEDTDAVMVVDPTDSQIHLDPLMWTDLGEYFKGVCVVDHITVQYPEGNSDSERVPLEMMSCVTIVKRLLRVRSWKVKTPNQLMRYLRDDKN
jgi:hypothetical protein